MGFADDVQTGNQEAIRTLEILSHQDAVKKINDECVIHRLIFGVDRNSNEHRVDILENLLGYNPDLYKRDSYGASILDCAVDGAILAIDERNDEHLKIYQRMIQIMLTKESELGVKMPNNLLSMKNSVGLTVQDRLTNAQKCSPNKDKVAELQKLINGGAEVKQGPVVSAQPDAVLRHRHHHGTLLKQPLKPVPQSTAGSNNAAVVGTIGGWFASVAGSIYSLWGNSSSAPLASSNKTHSATSLKEHGRRVS